MAEANKIDSAAQCFYKYIQVWIVTKSLKHEMGI